MHVQAPTVYQHLQYLYDGDYVSAVIMQIEDSKDKQHGVCVMLPQLIIPTSVVS